MSGVTVRNGGYYSIDCTGSRSEIFWPSTVSNLARSPKDDENRTYYFRVRAVDAAYGYANIGGLVYSQNGTWIDWHKPYVESFAIRELDGTHISHGDIIMAGEEVTLRVTGDPYGWEYSGVNESWIFYTVTTSAGSVIPNTVSCGGSVSECDVNIGSLSEDYTIEYTGFSRDRAGNVGWSQSNKFLVRKPLMLISSARDIFLTLGSYEYLHLDVSNRQNVNEEVRLTIDDAAILGNYQYAKFEQVPGGVLSDEDRTLTISLSPLETRPLSLMVYTATTGKWNLTVYANSTLPGHENINDAVTVTVRTLFPVEFPGLSWPAVILLLFLAGLAYLRLGAARR
jgi:hypothetical protein